MWTFEYSLECPVPPDFAWRFWTNVENWAMVDSSAESVRLDGPFAAGSTGTTKLAGGEPIIWQIVQVEEGRSATIEMAFPGATIQFWWGFGESEKGTRITQRITIEGERTADYERTAGTEFERGVPDGMRKLAETMARAAKQQL
jgi:Polyketide cyclase / dehydrase and lipid transport